MLQSRGYEVVKAAFPSVQLDTWRVQLDAILDSRATSICASRGTAYAIRNLTAMWPSVPSIVQSDPIANAVLDILGSKAGLARAIFYDKPPGRPLGNLAP